MTRFLFQLSLVLALVFVALPGAASAELLRTSFHPPHIRTVEPRLKFVISQGVQASTTFRALVAQLEQSDVVVYLEYERCVRRDATSLAGRLTFVSAAGGFRYVRVRVRSFASLNQEIAIVAHELQHAVEVADRPAIVDAASMLHEYSRFGRMTGITASGPTFDTRTAIDVGFQVQRELRSTTVARAE
jgi:hypothetical protein